LDARVGRDHDHDHEATRAAGGGKYRTVRKRTMSTEIKVAHHVVDDICIDWNTFTKNLPFEDEETRA
jgi:hypothetical protein